LLLGICALEGGPVDYLIAEPGQVPDPIQRRAMLVVTGLERVARELLRQRAWRSPNLAGVKVVEAVVQQPRGERARVSRKGPIRRELA